MSAAFGLHFGATSACIAVCKEGKAEVVANDAGDRVTPAIVAFTDHDQSVGLPAKQGLIRNANNTVCNVKHVIGCTSTDINMKEIKQYSSAKVVEKAGSPHYEVEYKEKTTIFSATDISSLIYKMLREIADNHGDAGDSHDAVLTVPLHFNDKQRQAVRSCAVKGGFNVLRVIDETSAAVLAYDVGQVNHHEDSLVLVYRLGGTSLDVSVVSVCNGMYQILATEHIGAVGGRHFTDLLVKHFITEFDRQWKCSCGENKRSVAKLRNAAENAKHVLSNLPTAQCSIESLYDGIDFQTNISRGRFEGMVSGLVTQCLQPVTTVLESARIDKSLVDKVILCGGSTKIPLLQKQLTNMFSNAEILNSLCPDEVIAFGASKQASLLEGYDADEAKENEKENDVQCTSADILVQVETDEGSDQVVVIKRFTPMPVRRQQTYQLQSEQSDFCLHIFYRDSSGTAQPLAKVVMKDIKGSTLIDVVYHLHSDGNLHVTCTEPTSSKAESVVIETS